MSDSSQINENKNLMKQFYSAFQNRDAESMASLYSEEAHFQDPVFKLEGSKIGSMWKMLCTNGKDLQISFSILHATETSGQTQWIAHYTFSSTGRKVINKITASFEFKDGKIIRHIDHFSFWKWASQALGPLGVLFGWTKAVKTRVQIIANKNLDSFLNLKK